MSDTAAIVRMKATMFRDQIVNFLEAAVAFLLVANVISVAATTYAMQLLSGVTGARGEPGIIERKLNAILRRAS